MKGIFLAAVATLCIGAGAASAESLKNPVIGPKLICFKYSTFTLNEGERITHSSGSPEGVSITVESPSGDFEVGEGEIYAQPKNARRLVYSKGRTSVYRVSGRRNMYAIYGPTSFSEGKDRLVIWLSGVNLKGGKGDRGVYQRFTVQDTSALGCQHTFTYSWDFLTE